MAVTTDKKSAVLQATLDVVAEHGLTGVTMSQIAEKSGASPGIIYHYFESKDEIITALFSAIEEEYFETLAAGRPLEMKSRERWKFTWLATFDHFVVRPKKLIFHEQYKNSIYYEKHGPIEDDPRWAPVVETIQKDIDQGLLKNLPLIVLYHMTAGLAVRLAKLQSAGLISLDRETLEAIADASCRSIEA